MSDIQDFTNTGLTDKENNLLEVLVNPDNRMKSISDICKLANCTRPIYYKAFSKQSFTDMYNARSKELVRQSVAPVINTFIREAQRGSFQHGKIILEMAGMYVEKQEVKSDNTNTNLNKDVSSMTPEELQKEIDELSKLE